MLSVRRKCVKYARALSSVGVRRNHQGSSDDVDGAWWWQSVGATNGRKKNIRSRSIFARAPAFGTWPPGCRVVFVLSEIFPVSVARNSSIQRSVKRLTTVRPYAHKFVCGCLFYYFRDTLRKPCNRVCTIKHLITCRCILWEKLFGNCIFLLIVCILLNAKYS